MNSSTLAVLSALAAFGPAPVPVAAPPSAPIALAAPQAPGRDYVLAPAGREVPRDAFYDALMSARVICVGEKHDEASQHLAQAEAVAQVAERDPVVVVGLEMVSQDQQPILDGFLSGRTSETEFAAWWNKTWGFDYSMYKPIFDVARARRLRMVGLNAPIGLVVAVARHGLSSLTPAERAQLPASIAESSDARYRGYVQSELVGHHLPPDALARMIEAQSVWNETMGAKAAELAASSRVLVLAGQGHMLWGAGIPESARRRGVAAAAVALPYPLDGAAKSSAEELARLRDPKTDDLALADGFILIPR
ncbi:MAG: ChaN family lipoprotein [Elusimicrobia bacterium]|nr:ChaN family lipoprotein [Elusimicrobiota bacterium]